MTSVQVALTTTTTMTDLRLPILQSPPRKPIATRNHGFPYQPSDGPPSQHNPAPRPLGSPSSHSRTRTTSSHIVQYPGAGAPVHSGSPAPQYPAGHHVPSRRLSSATTSTSSTGYNYLAHIAAAATAAGSDIQRTSSARSTSTTSQLGYVALMRRQKATVWCDRAQSEDARLRAQKMAEKKRALREVHGTSGRTGTLASSSKLKHGLKGAPTDFSPSTLVAATVPVRLSANEIGDGEDDALSENGMFHRRTGSGRSSLGSGHHLYAAGYQRSPASNNTPQNERVDLPEVSEHPQPPPPPASQPQSETLDLLQSDDEEQGHDHNDVGTHYSKGSDPEDGFGSLGDMAAPSAAVFASQKIKAADELRRRGSVDDRTMSLSTGRLFVANPDLSD